MKNVNAFVSLCKRVIADHTNGLMDFHLAAEKIYKQASEHPFEDGAHPMLYKVSNLSFYIAEDYHSEKDNEANWAIITKTIKSYAEGNWESTCWILSAIYGEYSKERLTHSFGVAIRRRNGETSIETAPDKLKVGCRAVINKLNVEQSDERYLQNLAKLIPAAIGKYKLVNVEVGEYLTEPYYSAA